VCRPILTRTSIPSGQACAERRRCVSIAAATAAGALAKTTKNESPSVLISRPFAAATASRTIAWCASSSGRYADVPIRSTSLVEPSMSVNRNVTVPAGSGLTEGIGRSAS
jgi:hypothetical protein